MRTDGVHHLGMWGSLQEPRQQSRLAEGKRDMYSRREAQVTKTFGVLDILT
jgi:hypothetical protein